MNTTRKAPTVKAQTTRDHGCETRTEVCPRGWRVIDCYHPHSTPWDYHGAKHLSETRAILSRHGIQSIMLRTRATILAPHGTGPGGRVRLGDADTPGVYRTAVHHTDKDRAVDLLAEYRTAIDKWIDSLRTKTPLEMPRYSTWTSKAKVAG